MIKIGANIKFLRKGKNLTQQEFADALNIKRSMVGAYEEERAKPKMENLKRIANFFSISVDELVSERINQKWFDDRIKRLEREQDRTAGNLKILSITVDREDRENIELVPIKASAGYVNGYADPEFVKELPRFSIPILKGGTFRAFEIQGDSMLPIYPGSIIIGEYVDDWKTIKSEGTYVIISKNEGIVYKRVQNRLKEDKTLRLKSDNKLYDPYSIHLDDILEVWKAKAYISLHFPETNVEHSIDHLTAMVKGLQKTISSMQKES